MKLALWPLLLVSAAAADLEISRPVRSWEFLDAAGPKAAFFGTEDGTLEAYVYPLKIARDLRLRFFIDGKPIPAGSVARRAVSRPGSRIVVYSGDEFEVRETLAASIDQPALALRIQSASYRPLRIDIEFTRDFQLLWPASIGAGYVEWSEREKAFLFGADGQPYAAVLGSPGGALVQREYATNYSAQTANVFTLGERQGQADQVVAIAGSVKSRADALETWKRAVAWAPRAAAEAGAYYRAYLDRTVALDLPDPRLQRAYDWSRVSVFQGMLDNPLLGEGLVAGYGPSKGAYRPGFAWFFGRDSFWTSFALVSAGDFASARKAIEFIARYQRDDGKIPHEISQTASLTPWFKDYPYGYASADGTPLFVVAVRNYVESSGDLEFARRLRQRLRKAMDFIESTSGPPGFARNLNVGHGWVEGGPLLPVRVELYQAACHVEALRSMGVLEDLLGDAARARAFEFQFQAKRKLLNQTFWLAAPRTFAFALDTSGRAVDQPSVLAAVPMWFGLLDTDRSQAMIETLSGERHAADWGMRIISTASPLYSPEGYHFGSVWPLFTGWASVGEYRNHAAQPALANLRANAWLALDGAGGNTTEVLSGMTYSPLSTASPHQIWSAAMVISPLLRGLLGLDVDAVRRRIRFAPHLPADWNRVGVRRVPLGAGVAEFALKRDNAALELTIDSSAAAFELEFAPAYAPPARIVRAVYSGAAAAWQEERNALDWHPRFTLAVKPGKSVLRIEHANVFGYAAPFEPPRLAGRSENLKVISERWSDGNRQLELTVSGRPGREYRLKLTGAAAVASVTGARLDGESLIVELPPGDSDEYAASAIRLRLPGPR